MSIDVWITSLEPVSVITVRVSSFSTCGASATAGAPQPRAGARPATEPAREQQDARARTPNRSPCTSPNDASCSAKASARHTPDVAHSHCRRAMMKVLSRHELNLQFVSSEPKVPRTTDLRAADGERETRETGGLRVIT